MKLDCWKCKTRGEPDNTYELIWGMSPREVAVAYATSHVLLNGEYVTVKGEGFYKIRADLTFRAVKR